MHSGGYCLLGVHIVRGLFAEFAYLDYSFRHSSISSA